jgi:hypothetical protein
MANTNYNKVIINGQTIIDLTGDTINPSYLALGITAHDKSGAIITGTSTKDSDTSDDTAAISEILYGKTAHARGALLTGTMPNLGDASGTLTTKTDSYPIEQGYHDGSGSVTIDPTEQAKIIGDNIREGVTILGVLGTMSGSEDVHAQSKTVTPTFASQTITPDTGYNYLSQVTVGAIPVTETDNAAGGVTVTVG